MEKGVGRGGEKGGSEEGKEGVGREGGSGEGRREKKVMQVGDTGRDTVE